MSAGAAPTWAVPDLPALLDRAVLLELLRRSGVNVDAVEITYRRVDPEAGGVAAVLLHGRSDAGDPVQVRGYVRTRPGGRSAELAAKWQKLKPRSTPLGDGVRLLDGGHSILFLFPNDARLRHLRFVTDKKKLKRILVGLDDVGPVGWRVSGKHSSFEEVRYKPERRYIARATLALRDDATGAAEDRPAFLRFFPDGRGARIDADARRLIAAGFPHVPAPMGALMDGRLHVEEGVAGEEMRLVVPRGEGDAEGLADRLLAFHRTPAVLAARRSPARLLRDALDGLALLARVAPHLAGKIEWIAHRLESSAPDRVITAPIHGDLHLRQILLGGDGPVLVDLERAGMGDPLEDVGQLIAQLRLFAAQEPVTADAVVGFEHRLIDRYLAQVPERPGLLFYLGCAFAGLAVTTFRRFEPGWAEGVDGVLELAEAALGAAPCRSAGEFLANETRPFVLYPRAKGPWAGWIDAGDDEKCFGLYQPGVDRFDLVSPEEDPVLAPVAAWFERGETVSYRVGRRAVICLDGSPASRYAKLLAPRKAERLLWRHRLAAQLREDGPPHFPATPRVVPGEDPGVLLLDALEGDSLHTILVRRRGDRSRALAQVAAGLAVFHGVVAPAELPATGGTMTLDDWAAIAFRHFPDLEPRLQDALRDVRDLVVHGHAPALVHGDLHDRNIMVDGDEVGLLDLDALGAGNPVEDVGNLVAHFMLRALQAGVESEEGWRDGAAFLAAYRSAGGSANEAEVTAVSARTLVRLACLYAFRKRWQHLVPRLLEAASSRARCAC